MYNIYTQILRASPSLKTIWVFVALFSTFSYVRGTIKFMFINDLDDQNTKYVFVLRGPHVVYLNLKF